MDDQILARKSLGQHWLHDEASLESIVNSVEITSDDTVLEIGPGLGTLTQKLLQKAGKVIAVELDEMLSDRLKREITDPKLEVISENILRFDLTKLPKNYIVVANIPYYLTSHLLRILSETTNPFRAAALLLQKEVAERVAAKPGEMSLLSISVQLYNEVSLGAVIPANKFSPPPKVDSQVLILHRLSGERYQGIDRQLFFQIVKAGFSHKRKTLQNSISAGLHMDRSEAEAKILSAGLSPASRPQSLSLDEWFQLYQQIKLPSSTQ